MNKPQKKKKKALPKPLLISGTELFLQVLECLTLFFINLTCSHICTYRALDKTTYSERMLGYGERTIHLQGTLAGGALLVPTGGQIL